MLRPAHSFGDAGSSCTPMSDCAARYPDWWPTDYEPPPATALPPRPLTPPPKPGPQAPPPQQLPASQAGPQAPPPKQRTQETQTRPGLTPRFTPRNQGTQTSG